MAAFRRKMTQECAKRYETAREIISMGVIASQCEYAKLKRAFESNGSPLERSATTTYAAKCYMISRSRTENENVDLVMPAWTAGIQFRKDASEDIRVDLDSSTPRWNDAIGGLCFNDRSPSSLIFTAALLVDREAQ